jgi:hypothetical protein
MTFIVLIDSVSMRFSENRTFFTGFSSLIAKQASFLENLLRYVSLEKPRIAPISPQSAVRGGRENVRGEVVVKNFRKWAYSLHTSNTSTFSMSIRD